MKSEMVWGVYPMSELSLGSLRSFDVWSWMPLAIWAVVEP